MLTLSKHSRTRAGAFLTAIITATAVMASSAPALAAEADPSLGSITEVIENAEVVESDVVDGEHSASEGDTAEGDSAEGGTAASTETPTTGAPAGEAPDNESGARDSDSPSATQPSVEDAVEVPTVSVSKTEGLVDGEVITVSGENFAPVAPSTNGTRPPLAGQFGGVYVVFGSYADSWKPSEGAGSATRKAAPGQTRWVVNPGNVAQIGGAAAGAVAIEADGSFEVELTVTEEFAGMLEDGNLGVFTFSGSGAVYAPFETETFLTFAEPVVSSLTLTADPSSIEVGESTTLRALVAPATAGTVEFFDGERSLGNSTVDLTTGIAERSYADVPEGSRSLRAVFTPADPDAASSAEGVAVVTVTAPVVTVPTSSGSLRWGVKQSFRDYVTGNIAQGTIRVAGADSDGAIVIFPQSSPAGSSEVVQYGGSVRYLGHNGALDVTIASPTVRLVSSSRAELVATVNGSRVTLATLALSTGARSELPGGAVRYSGVAATLTAAGAPVFSFGGTAFYPAGTALDSVTFTIGAPSSAGGQNRIVGAFAGSSIPSAPPATTGAEIVGDDADALEPGQRITISASGFASNEQNIAVVAYSDPIVLSESVTADADGIASWTGTLPADLIGVHTLTMQGSVDRGVVVTIRELAQTVSLAGACVIQDAQLEWGFKEAFRAYVSGSIANGEWQLLDGAEYETPTFSFTGEGALDSSTGEGELVFTGGIRFTGHSGILDTSVSNPRVVVIDADTAQLVLDVVGTTQEGVAVEATGVVFADLDLSAASRSAENGVLTIEGAPATLTATGAEAFGTYPAGEPLDAVSITGTLADDCGAVIVAEPEPEATAVEGGVPWWVWAVIIALLVAVIVLAVALLRRRAASQ